MFPNKVQCFLGSRSSSGLSYRPFSEIILSNYKVLKTILSRVQRSYMVNSNDLERSGRNDRVNVFFFCRSFLPLTWIASVDELMYFFSNSRPPISFLDLVDSSSGLEVSCSFSFVDIPDNFFVRWLDNYRFPFSIMPDLSSVSEESIVWIIFLGFLEYFELRWV